jgi:hypothetical protein
MMMERRRVRDWVSRGGTVIGVIFLVSILDTFVCAHLDKKYTFRALPGTRQPVSGDLLQPVRQASDVQYQFDRPGMNLTVAAVRGRTWRGLLTVPPASFAGIYQLKLSASDLADPGTVSVCRIAVFSSIAAMNASYPSLFYRFLGIAPWKISVAALPLLLASLALSFCLAGGQEALLRDQNLAPIIKMARQRDHWDLAAAATHTHGAAVGSCLEVLDRRMQPVARLTVTRIADEVIFGQVELPAPVTPDGYLRVR